MDGDWLGPLMFGVVFLSLIWVGERYADTEERPKGSTRTLGDLAGGAVSTVVIVAAATIVIAGPAVGAALTSGCRIPVAEQPIPALERCTDPVPWESEYAPVFPEADLSQGVVSSCGDLETAVFLASYGEQQQGKELVSWSNRVWPASWRQYADQSTVSIRVGERELAVRQILFRHPEGWHLTWYWYQVGSRLSTSDFGVKLLETMHAVTRQPAESSVVVLSAMSTETENLAALDAELHRHVARVSEWNLRRVETEATP